MRLQTAVENLAQVAPDVAAKRDGGHRGWEGISSMLSGLLGYSKPLPPSHSQNPSLSSMGAVSAWVTGSLVVSERPVRK